MRANPIGVLWHWARQGWLVTQARAIILVYHRIANLPSDPQLLCVTPEHFAEHLEHICRHFHPISLGGLGRALAIKQVPHRAVVITFDDGYADNLHNAKPILECFNVPATVFATTGYVGQEREFWWDELERHLLLPAKLPDLLELNINDWTCSWQTGQEEYAGNDQETNTGWNVNMKFYPTPRHRAYAELHHLLRPLDDSGRKKVLDEITRWARVTSEARPDYRALNTMELNLLVKDGLVEIGSHTITHPVLSAQPLESQRREILQSKQDLEAILNQPITSFCYPYGNRYEDSSATVQLVREAGYELACANFPAPVTRRSDALWLPRFLVRDWDGEDFTQRLRRWFHG